MGYGNPMHLTSMSIIPTLPGVYHVTHTAHAPFDGNTLPLIINPEQEWVNLDVLNFALEQGYEVRIHEAYLFENRTKVLDEWALAVWNARQSLLERYGKEHPAVKEIKRLATMGVGSFATSKEKQESHAWIHLNFWTDAVSKARVNILANLLKYAKAGYRPKLVYSDGLWFVTSESDYSLAVPDILDRAGKLGGYHYEYSFPVTSELVEKVQTLSPGQVVTEFNHMGGKGNA